MTAALDDHFEHLTQDEEREARRRLARDDARDDDHPPTDHSGQDDHPNHGCGCLVAILLIALAGLGGWLLS